MTSWEGRASSPTSRRPTAKPSTPTSRRPRAPASRPGSSLPSFTGCVRTAGPTRSGLTHELGVIHRTGYAAYFLIVEDFIRFARERSIPVGPGRGSAAGSLVAYALHITDIDPLAHGLLFERFLNAERVSPPDIDVDFLRDAAGGGALLRHGEVRRRPGGADPHAQHDAGAAGRPRRGTDAGPPAPAGGSTGQAHSVRRQARRSREAGPAAARGAAGSADRPPLRAGATPRGPPAFGRHPRRRRRRRSEAAHGHRAAVPRDGESGRRPRQNRRRGERSRRRPVANAVRHEGLRGDRAVQDGLPGPPGADPDRGLRPPDRRGRLGRKQRGRRRDPAPHPRRTLREGPPRSLDLRALRPRRHRRDLPVRERRDARTPRELRAGEPGRPRGHERALSPGPAEQRHDGRVRRRQAEAGRTLEEARPTGPASVPGYARAHPSIRSR